ncbi:MAG: glycosyltransferase [Pseudomonadales bacterium]|nr:glycosyltransferase [Pseudomonadales bacterium]
MPHSFDLVFTVALKQELPLEHLTLQKMPVCTVAAAQSGFLKSLPSEQQRGILFLITGVGAKKSQQAAEWITSELAPMFVVNIGSAGAFSETIHTWIAPTHVTNEQHEGPAIQLAPLPFVNTVVNKGRLMSTLSPYSAGAPHENTSTPPVDFVDMEAYWQAEVFQAQGIPFSSLKFVSDHCNVSSLENYQQALISMREACVDMLTPLFNQEELRISVIIPVHNRPEWIAETVNTVRAQTLPAFDIIVVDDGSDAPLDTCLADHLDAITLLRLPENRGVSAARNAGVAAAKGNWLAFLDSDDHWATKKLADQASYLQQHPYLIALQCEEIWVRNGIRVNAHKHHQKKAGWIWKNCLKACLITPSALLIKSTVYSELGGFDESVLSCEDYDLWLRLSRKYPVGLSPNQGLIKHGGHEDQLSYRHPVMDRFRVYSLIKALLSEGDTHFRQALLDILTKKITILSLGAKKRGLENETRAYETLLAQLKTGENNSCPDLSLETIQWLLARSPKIN